MVDQNVIDGLLNNLRAYVSELKRLSRLTTDEFLTDPDKVASAKYYLIVAIESCVDLAHHIISSERLRRPTDFADAFKVLGEADIVSNDLLVRLENMARFRNLLVHLYAKVDNSRVYEFLQKDLNDFDSFAKAIAAFAQGPYAE